MDNSLIAEFENLKISALSKSKSINTHIHNVTIGPNSRILEDSTNVTPKKISRDDGAKSPQKLNSSSLRQRKSPVAKMLVEAETQRINEVQVCIFLYYVCIFLNYLCIFLYYACMYICKKMKLF